MQCNNTRYGCGAVSPALVFTVLTSGAAWWDVMLVWVVLRF